MERQYVESSNVRSIGYDENLCILEVEFHSGLVYQYYDVPSYVYYEFMTADSKGGFLHQNIKDHFVCQRIE